MAIEGKGRTTFVHSDKPNEVTIINGAILVKLVPRGTRGVGYGSAQLWDGIASHGEARIINGAVKVKFV